MPRHFVYALSVLGTILLAGCSNQSSPPASIDGGSPEDSVAGGSTGPAETYPCVISQEAEYYTTGPQQGRPPDGTFPAGTKVNVRRRTGGYWLVRTADGVEGYVLGESVQQPGDEAFP